MQGHSHIVLVATMNRHKERVSFTFQGRSIFNVACEQLPVTASQSKTNKTTKTFIPPRIEFEHGDEFVIHRCCPGELSALPRWNKSVADQRAIAQQIFGSARACREARYKSDGDQFGHHGHSHDGYVYNLVCASQQAIESASVGLELYYSSDLSAAILFAIWDTPSSNTLLTIY